MANEFDTPTNVMHSDRLLELTERIRKSTGEIPRVIQGSAIITDHVIEMEAEWEDELPPLPPPPLAVAPKRITGKLIALMLLLAVTPGATVVCAHQLAPIFHDWLAHR